MKFTVIIPVYNVEKYIEECLKSVVMQTYKDYEVLIIDDGSTDNSGKICEEYAEKYKNFRIIHKENGGISSTRNKGVENSKGEYILFLDSDDYWNDEKMLEKIANVIEKDNPDLVVFQTKIFEDGSNKATVKKDNLDEKFNEEHLTGSRFLLKVLGNSIEYEWFPYLYAFKKNDEMISNLVFNEKTYAFEDAEVLYKVILKARNVKIITEPFYSYRMKRKNSLTRTNEKLLKSILTVAAVNIENVQNMSVEKELKYKLSNNFAHFYYIVLILINQLENEQKKDIYELLVKNKWIVKYTCYGKDIILKYLVLSLGIKVTSGLLGIRMKLRGTA